MKLLVVLLLLSCLNCNAQSNLEVGVLIAIKQQLNDNGKHLGSWYANQISPCQFFGVTCANGYVTELTLISLGFNGTLSPALANLAHLNALNLFNNSITGKIPEQLGNLSSLNILNLQNNLFSGAIPVSLGNLSKLQTLILSGNNLSGSIPESLAKLSSLKDIEIASNKLSGQIPDPLFHVEIYNFSNNFLNCGGDSLHQCTPASPSPAKGNSHKPSIGVILGGIFGLLGLLAMVIVFVICNFRRNKNKNSDVFQDVEGEIECKISLGQLVKFSLNQLKAATDDFSEKHVLGQGGFGKVYKGTLCDQEGKPIKVAVKRLINVERPGGEEAFQREVELISVAVHRNLLRLLGFCVTPRERLLVYPFMENSSVADCLRDWKPGKVLDWPTRKRIALGAAQGLEYLHEHCDPKIIHRDVKAANVLLDTDFEAVVGDFGLAQLVDISKTSVTTQAVRGTHGHIAPEYLKTGRSSEKTDVFGYGIMLLELVTGRRAISFEEEDEILLIDHVNGLYREKRLDAIIDPKLNGMYDSQGAEMLIQVSLRCTQDSPDSRPAMSEVVHILEGEELPEKWEDLQEGQVSHRPTFEIEQLRRNCLRNGEESLYIPDAIELSDGR